MYFDYEGNRYEVLLATDDAGVRCELWDVATNKHLIEIFKNEQLKKVEFYCTGLTLPLDVLEKVLEHFHSSVGKNFE